MKTIKIGYEHTPNQLTTYDVNQDAYSKLLETHPGGDKVIEENRANVTPFISFHSERARKKFERMLAEDATPEDDVMPKKSAPTLTKTLNRSAYFSGFSSSKEGGAEITVFDPENGRVVRPAGDNRALPEDVEKIHNEFRTWIKGRKTFPCVAGKATIDQASYVLGIFPHSLEDTKNTEALLQSLKDFMAYQSQQWEQGNHFTTFIAVFPHTETGSIDDKSEPAPREIRLHSKYQSQQRDAIDRLDEKLTEGMSEALRTYSIVSLHPRAERKSHRFSYPAMVFNAGPQFSFLENTEQFDPLQKEVRKRDKPISGLKDGKEFEPENLTLHLFVPQEVLGREIYSLETKLADKGWTANPASIQQVFDQLKSHLRFMPSIGKTLVRLGENLGKLNDAQKEDLEKWIQENLENISPDEHGQLSKTLKANGKYLTKDLRNCVKKLNAGALNMEPLNKQKWVDRQLGKDMKEVSIQSAESATQRNLRPKRKAPEDQTSIGNRKRVQ